MTASGLRVISGAPCLQQHGCISASILTCCSHCPHMASSCKDAGRGGFGGQVLQLSLICTDYICNDPVFQSGHILRSWALEHVCLGGNSLTQNIREEESFPKVFITFNIYIFKKYSICLHCIKMKPNNISFRNIQNVGFSPFVLGWQRTLKKYFFGEGNVFGPKP